MTATTKNWIQCDAITFDKTLQNARDDGMVFITERSMNKTIYRSSRGEAIAQVNDYPKSTQCLLAISMKTHMPFQASKERSIYE